MTPTPTSVPPTATPTSPPEPTWKADGRIDEGEYAHAIEAAGVTFHWMNDAEHLYVALAADTGGWISVGFDPEGKMQGANFILGYVQDGQTFIQDMFGTKPAGPGSHPSDEDLGGSNDVLEYGGQEKGSLTVIEFKIPLDSGDRYDKPLRSGASYDLILAVGSSDDFDSYHAARDYGKMTLD